MKPEARNRPVALTADEIFALRCWCELLRQLIADAEAVPGGLKDEVQ
jgi:hypothetical protein